MKNLFYFLIIIPFYFYSCQKQNANKNYVVNLDKIDTLANSEYKNILSYYKELDSISASNNNPELYNLKLYTQGILSSRNGDFFKAISLFHNAETGDAGEKLHGKIYNAIGINYLNMSKYDSAVYYFQKSKKVFENTGNDLGAQKADVNIAQLFYDMGNSAGSLEIIENIINSPKSNTNKLKALHLKANIYGEANQINKAKSIDIKALSSKAIESEPFYNSMFYNNLALCYLAEMNVDSAYYYCKKSLEIDSINKFESNVAINYTLLADIALNADNNMNLAMSYYEKAKNILHKNNDDDKLLFLYKQLKNICYSHGNLKDAIVYQDSVEIIGNRINNLRLNRSIAQMKIEFETEKKDHLLDKQKITIINQQIIIASTIVIAILLALVLIVINRNRKRKHQLKLEEQKRKIIEVSSEAEINERERLARELHDGVCQKLVIAQMQISNNESEFVEGFAKYIQEISKEIRDVSHNLQPQDFSKGLVPIIREMTEQVNYSSKSMKMHLNVDEERIVNIENKNLVSIIYRCLQETVQNAIKHAKAKNLWVEISSTGRELIIKIKDDGKGMDIKLLEENKGMGINGIHKRISAINGFVELTSSDGMGVEYKFKIPLNNG